MAEQVVFGRRQTPPARRNPARSDERALDPKAEAFRIGLKAGEPEEASFAAWRRSQAGGRILAWGLAFGLLLPGLVCFALDVSTPVAIGVEGLGLLGGWLVRRERKRRLRAIASWEPPAPG